MTFEQNAPLVVKIGGNDLDTPGFIDALAAALAVVQQQTPHIVLVHGGGQAINRLQQRLGLIPQYIDGQRVTDEAALEAAEMMLSGSVNKTLTQALLAAGVDAIGISGVDRGLLTVEPWSAGMGRVGRIVRVRAEVLAQLLALGVVPVVSPISLGPDGRYNVNADHAAGAIAGALGAHQATFITNVPGVRVDDGGDVAAQLSVSRTHELIAAQVITGGMIPKVHAALAAVEQGVTRAVITDLAGFAAGTGTAIITHEELRS